MLIQTKLKGFWFLLFCLLGFSALSQTDSATLARQTIRKREAGVYTGIGLFYGGLGYGLYNTWYKDYNTGKFHFFNDNSEWKQMDKLGHAYSCYSEAVNGMNLMDYAGLPKKKAMWIGGFIGFGVQTMIEVMDGYSNKWGFSWGDMGANMIGTSLALSQRYYWNEQRIKLCYSFHQSDLRHLRPELLGSNYITGVLKDYNALTGWLSVNVSGFAPSSKWPAWLNLAVGYGAYGMLTGNPNDNNIFVSKGILYNYSNIKPYRILYFAPDISLQKIPFIKKHHTLFLIARFLAPLKVPLPTISLDKKNGLKFYPFYF